MNDLSHQKLSVRRQAFVLSAFLLLGVVLLYRGTWSFPFVLDDTSSIELNSRVFTLTPISKFFQSMRPLVDFTFALNFAFGRFNTIGYHLFNTLVHVTSALALFGCVYETLRRQRFRDRFSSSGALWFGFSVALLWAVHPLNTQAVTYIAQRAESMMGMFLLLLMYCSIRADTSSPWRWAWIVAAGVCGLLGVASKQIMVAAPLMVVFYDWTFGEQSLRRTLVRRAPLYVAVGASWILLLVLLRFGRELVAEGSSAGFGSGATWFEYLRTQAGVILQYLKLSVYPVGQCFDYGWPLAHALSEYVPQGIAVIALLAVSLDGLVRRRWYGFVGMWFLCILAPTSSFVPIADRAFEHRMYLPLASVVVMVVAAATWLVGRLSRTMQPRFAMSAAVAPVLVVALLLSVLTARRNQIYQSTIDVWHSVVEHPIGRHHIRAYINLSDSYSKAGQPVQAIEWARKGLERRKAPPLYAALASNHRKLGQLDTALEYANKALAGNDDYSRGLAVRGVILKAMNRLPEAAADFRRAVEIEPRYVRAAALLGEVLGEMGQLQEAVAVLEDALTRAPESIELHRILAERYIDLEQAKPAARHLQFILSVNPRDVRALWRLGWLMGRVGDLDAAARLVAEAMRVDPSDPAPCAIMAKILFKQRRLEAALLHVDQAIGLGAEAAEVFRDRGDILQRMGRIEEAKAAWEEALERDEADELTRLRLAWLLATSPDAALRDGPRALQVIEPVVDSAHPVRRYLAHDVMAAAAAEAGDFEQAVALQSEAMRLAAEQGNAKEAASMAQRREQYREMKPYRDTPK